jgi:hypothetical protein
VFSRSRKTDEITIAKVRAAETEPDLPSCCRFRQPALRRVVTAGKQLLFQQRGGRGLPGYGTFAFIQRFYGSTFMPEKRLGPTV